MKGFDVCEVHVSLEFCPNEAIDLHLRPLQEHAAGSFFAPSLAVFAPEPSIEGSLTTDNDCADVLMLLANVRGGIRY